MATATYRRTTSISGSAAADEALLADGAQGAAFRQVVVHGENIVDNTIPTAKYGNDTVTEAKLSPAVRDLLNDGGVTHVESGATYNNNVITVQTTGTVRGGDGILFAVPSPFGTSSTQAVRLAIDGQANSTHPLHDRNGDALHEDDLTVGSVYIAISDADSWDILVLPAGSGVALSSTTPSAHGIGQGGSAGTATQASRGDHVHAIPVGVPVAIGTENDEGTATTAARSDHVHAGVNWGFKLDTVIVPELNQDAISTARIVLEDSGLTHYLAFLDWTAANLASISHLPVGAHIGLRQGTATRILEVVAEWDATNNRYQVTNVNAAALLEAASGTATELLLTAGASGGAAGATDYTRTLIGTSASMGTSVVTLNFSEAIEDGELIEILWRASAGGRVYGQSLVSADAILDLTAQTTEPGTVTAAMPFKIGDTATQLDGFGHGSGYVWLIDTDSIYVANGRQRAMVAEFYKLVPPAGGAGGQESPPPEGVAALTADLVEVTLYKWVLSTDGKPADPTAHWRFDDEWDGTTPFQGGGWYVSRATALDEADNNPAFSEDTWTLWIANEQTRRRVVSEAYSYTDYGYTVTAAWDIQYSTDRGTTWTSVQPSGSNYFIRYRNQETGLFGPPIPVGTSGLNDWVPIRTNDLVYPGGANVDELDAVYDFGNFAELLFIVAGYRSVTVDDGLGGTVIVGVNGPWHHAVFNRGSGWPVADDSEGEDNNDANDGSCLQFTYFATNTGVGLQIWERGDNYVDPGNPPFLQNDGEPPTQLGGHFKLVSTDGDEAHVTKFRFFAFSHAFARTTMSIWARYR